MSLSDDLAAVVAAGGEHPSTISGAARAPKGWEPGVKYEPTGPIIVTTGPVLVDVQRDETAWHGLVEKLGLTVPPGWRLVLREASFDPAAWHRDAQGEDAVTRPVWRYRFAIEPHTIDLIREDVDTIIREVMRAKRKPRTAPETVQRALVVVYADAQAGKVALLGGTRELAQRVRTCIDLLEDHLRDLKKVGRMPEQAAWLDAGDCIEGFESQKSQRFTNDLTMTQQVRAHRRLSLEGIGFLARRFDDVIATTCGSNHARVRAGKDVLGPPDDDWGIEVLSQVQDAYAHNPDTFGHVRFAYPDPWRDTVCVELAGVPVGLVHGHQVNQPSQLERWWKEQAFGKQPVTDARVLVSGHFHHWASQEFGDGRLWVQAPTLDGGSDWFTMRRGDITDPGMVVFTIRSDGGWDDLRILRP